MDYWSSAFLAINRHGLTVPMQAGDNQIRTIAACVSRESCLSEAMQYRGLHVTGWLLFATAAIFLADPAGRYLGLRVHYWALVAINLALALPFGLLGRSASWKQRGLVVLVCIALPMLYIIFMLIFGCALWNTLAGRYRCGL